ncbi:programmed cell death 1 ligand 1 isoform X2 [Electrophorus electricus]|uniref:programmed cell death 1 ligand 1 isoform X2 n=1 Tax=Electrophorus electricus TaxID=8005 RepID=UPI0015D0BCC6|nr:programmed cell death 1 ligand 1 isoform X2 [Electrophorus electricus]
MMENIQFRTSNSFLLLFVCGVSCYTKFDISVPPSPQVRVYGQAMVLPCTFPVGNSWDPSSSVITWQRGSEVVHSFYHGRDQLARQGLHYANRTRLYHDEMERGNASLRLERTTLGDAGYYTCSVTTQIGSQKKSFSVKIGAFYLEPFIHVSLLSNGRIDLLISSQGGYPSPSVQWLMGDKEDLTNVTFTQLEQDKDTKLYNMNSKLNLTSVINTSITFILKNEELGQEIRRNINLFSDGRNFKRSDTRIVGFYVLIGVLLIGVTLAAVFILRQRKQNSFPSYNSKGTAGSPDCQGTPSKETTPDKTWNPTELALYRSAVVTSPSIESQNGHGDCNG